MLEKLYGKLTKRVKVTFLSTLVVGLITHAFALTNTLVNYDNARWYYTGYGHGIVLGRWALEALGTWIGACFGGYNLTFLNGFLVILLLAVTACVLVELFSFRHSYAWVLTGGLLTAFPAVVSTMFFRFTAPYYMLALLLAVLAVYLTRTRRFGMFPAAVLMAVSLGLYQAYFPMMAALFVASLIQEALNPANTWKQVLAHSVKFFLTMVLSYVLYLVFLKVCLAVFQAELWDYQGLDEMGLMPLTDIAAAVVRAAKSFLTIVFFDYAQAAPTPLIRKEILILGAVSVVLMLILVVRTKGWLKRIEIAVLSLLFPIAVNSIEIICYGTYIYTLMVCAVYCIFLVPLILLDCVEAVVPASSPCEDGRNHCKTLHQLCTYLVAAVSTAALICYMVAAEANYAQMKRHQQQAQTYLASFVTQVRMTEGYRKDLEWAVIGETFQDPMLVGDELNWDMLYASNMSIVNMDHRYDFLYGYLRYDIPWADEEAVARLKQNEAVRDMPTYPDDGSIRIIGDYVVIKLEPIA